MMKAVIRYLYRLFLKPFKLSLQCRKAFFFELEKFSSGKKLFTKIKNEHDCVFVLPYTSLGDAYIVSLFLSENSFCKYDYVLCVASEKCVFIAQSLGIKNIECISLEELDSLKKYILVTGEDESKRILHFHYYRTSLMDKIINRYGFNFLQCYRNFVFKSDIREPSREIDIFSAKKTSFGDGSVIIAPYSNSLKTLPLSFWTALVARLKKVGFCDIFTNVSVSSEVPISGTEPCHLALNDICQVMNGISLFFSIRSGLCDFVSRTKCKKYIFYPKLDCMFESKSFYTLSQLPRARNFYEYEIGMDEFCYEENLDEIFRSLLSSGENVCM